jgi:hypothetical protein
MNGTNNEFYNHSGFFENAGGKIGILINYTSEVPMRCNEHTRSGIPIINSTIHFEYRPHIHSL